MLIINQLICHGRESKQCTQRTCTLTQCPQSKSKEYACIFQQEHPKNLIHLQGIKIWFILDFPLANST
jgi:hypothetical protein